MDDDDEDVHVPLAARWRGAVQAHPPAAAGGHGHGGGARGGGARGGGARGGGARGGDHRSRGGGDDRDRGGGGGPPGPTVVSSGSALESGLRPSATSQLSSSGSFPTPMPPARGCKEGAEQAPSPFV